MNGLVNIRLCAYFGCVPFTVAYSISIHLPLRNTSLCESTSISHYMCKNFLKYAFLFSTFRRLCILTVCL
jgi:hypothetical protein